MSLNPIKVILIDDDERIVKSAKMYLNKDFDTTLCSSGKEALQILKNNKFDVIVTDYNMPEFNGLELLDSLSKEKIKTPVIVMSGELNLQISMKFSNLKVFHIFEKPLKFSEINTKIIEAYNYIQEQEKTTKLALIGKNAGQIIHDINNNLGIIMMSSDVGQTIPLQSEKTQHLFSKSKQACNKIVDIIARYKKLINDNKIELKEYSIKEFATILSNEVSDYTNSYNIATEIKSCDYNDKISVDLTLIRQVILNLMSNAKDSMLVNKRPKINFSINKEGEYLYLKIKDNGGGIPEHIKSKLFQENNSSKGDNGTGLGLSYCKLVIELHFGKIWLSETSENGTEFLIKLPIS